MLVLRGWLRVEDVCQLDGRGRQEQKDFQAASACRSAESRSVVEQASKTKQERVVV